MKRPTKNGFEQDAFGNWGKRFCCYLQRAGVRKEAKRNWNRRDRHTIHHELRGHQDES
jgi:hypothetical protein